jgi:hypothetical protein
MGNSRVSPPLLVVRFPFCVSTDQPNEIPGASMLAPKAAPTARPRRDFRIAFIAFSCLLPFEFDFEFSKDVTPA